MLPPPPVLAPPVGAAELDDTSGAGAVGDTDMDGDAVVGGGAGVVGGGVTGGGVVGGGVDLHVQVGVGVGGGGVGVEVWHVQVGVGVGVGVQ